MRYGPCCGCGRSIPWEDQYCLRCEQKIEHEEMLENERREYICGVLETAAKEGWCKLDDQLFCSVHAPDGAEPVKADDFDDLIDDLSEETLTLECEHDDGCDCLGEWDLPVVQEDDGGY